MAFDKDLCGKGKRKAVWWRWRCSVDLKGGSWASSGPYFVSLARGAVRRCAGGRRCVRPYGTLHLSREQPKPSWIRARQSDRAHPGRPRQRRVRPGGPPAARGHPISLTSAQTHGMSHASGRNGLLGAIWRLPGERAVRAISCHEGGLRLADLLSTYWRPTVNTHLESHRCTTGSSWTGRWAFEAGTPARIVLCIGRVICHSFLLRSDCHPTNRHNPSFPAPLWGPHYGSSYVMLCHLYDCMCQILPPRGTFKRISLENMMLFVWRTIAMETLGAFNRRSLHLT